MKYVDVEKLKSEIIRIYNEHPVHSTERYEDGIEDGYHGCCDEIVEVIDSLQQEQSEVDFEKELDRIWFDNKFGNRFDNSAVDFANVRWICKHFYELGRRLCSK